MSPHAAEKDCCFLLLGLYYLKTSFLLALLVIIKLSPSALQSVGKPHGWLAAVCHVTLSDYSNRSQLLLLTTTDIDILLQIFFLKLQAILCRFFFFLRRCLWAHTFALSPWKCEVWVTEASGTTGFEFSELSFAEDDWLEMAFNNLCSQLWLFIEVPSAIEVHLAIVLSPHPP